MNKINATPILLLLIRFYRLFFSPFVGQHCRFEPTCSHYAEEAVRTHGPLKGCVITAKRLGRCHPWCDGGYDPIPEKTDN